MRFEDNQIGWQEVLEALQTNRYVSDYLRAISSHKLQLVPNTVAIAANTAIGMCHQYVRDRVETSGGEAVYGWQVVPWLFRDDPQFDYIVNSAFHCNWCSDDGELINITPMEGSYHIFLRDDRRSFDFDKRMSFNNRTIYLDGCKVPSYAARPSTNVTYFTAGGYASRDKTFERYIIPISKDEIRDALPNRFIDPVNPDNLSQEALQWISLKFSIKM